MFFVNLVLSFSSFLLLYILYLKLTKKHPLQLINYPFLRMFPALLINIPRDIHSWITDVARYTHGTFDFRGPLLLNMDIIITADPADVNHVFSINSSNYAKSKIYTEIFDLLGHGIFNIDGDYWRTERKKMRATFTAPTFRELLKRRAKEKVEHGLIPLLERLADSGQVVDFQDVTMRLAFDMTFNLVFGTDPMSLTMDFANVPFTKAMDLSMEVIFLRHLLPAACWKVMRRLRIWKEKEAADVRKVIEEFLATNAKNTTEEGMLSSYIDGDNDKYVRDTALAFLFAGRDSTGSALAWFFWLLTNNPRVEEEILEQRRKNEENSAVYLHAALCEVLRLYPPIPFEHRDAVEADTLPSGVQVPRGRMVLASIYSMGRMEEVWGNDCLEYRPERWISMGAEEKMKMKHVPAYKFMAFNCGPRMCLGKEVSFVQMEAVAAAVVGRFEFEEVEGQVVQPKMSVILQMKNGWKVRIKRKTNK